MNGNDVRVYFHKEVARTTAGTVYDLSSGIKGAINGILTKACGGEENRRLVLKYLTGFTTSRLLDAAQWLVLAELVRPDKPEGMPWQSGNPKFQRAIDAILADLPRQEGQQEMEL